MHIFILYLLALYLIETPLNAFADRADPGQAVLQELPDQGLLCIWKYNISDPTLVDLTSNFFVLCTITNVYLYNYS